MLFDGVRLAAVSSERLEDRITVKKAAIVNGYEGLLRRQERAVDECNAHADGLRNVARREGRAAMDLHRPPKC